MALAEIFSSGLTSIAKSTSRDSKIYEAFKPYLSDILGIDLETFLKNKELRRAYQQKYETIKEKFQSESTSRTPMKDEECLTRIVGYSGAWKEIITTAQEYTLDHGESIIKDIPLDKYILMSNSQKELLEQRIIVAAVERVKVISEQQAELHEMLRKENNKINMSETHKTQ